MAATESVHEALPPTVVCGVDHSPGARAAARFAADFADRIESRLVLVHAVQPPVPHGELGMAAAAPDWPVIHDLQRAGENLLAELEQELGASGRALATDIRLGYASNVVAAAAVHDVAEFIIVGSRGLGSVGALILGSVSRSLAVEGPCPVVIVPESAGTVGDTPIMCAVDDSEESRAALVTALMLAGRLNAKLVLAHAATDDVHAGRGEELLARLVVENGLGTSTERILVRGEPAEAVAQAATARAVGMVVMGSRGRGVLASAALGSVSSAVAASARCAVTIVRRDYTR